MGFSSESLPVWTPLLPLLLFGLSVVLVVNPFTILGWMLVNECRASWC